MTLRPPFEAEKTIELSYRCAVALAGFDRDRRAAFELRAFIARRNRENWR